MPEMLPVLIFIVAAVLVAMAAYAAHKQQKRRTEELRTFALERGWQFTPTALGPGDLTFMSPFGTFERGHARIAYNTMRGSIVIGERSWPVLTGDYQYKTTSGTGKNKRTTTHRLSYLIVETPYLGAPELFIRREHFLDRFAGFMGFDDIDFESNEFSERFHVKSADKRFAFAVIQPRMMEFLLAGETPAVEFRRGYCLFERRGSWTAAEFAGTIDWAFEFFSRWPEHVPSVLDA
jgi:hypothetical protein